MITVVDHDPGWMAQFESESRRIRQVAGEAVINIHHIGSTAIPGIKAKPVIDLLLEVGSLDAIDQATHRLQSLGYEAMGEFGLPGRRYFRLDNADGIRTHQVHAYKAGVPDVVRHVAFRDYMRAHPEEAADYGFLKERLAQAYPDDRDAYNLGKDAFVKEHERRALSWAGSLGATAGK
ncbi:MAG: GrpB family protein [Lysobacteraceae bacterium]|nr:MAG: GrpB family protein [Xanthomonadaceae bacterium]